MISGYDHTEIAGILRQKYEEIYGKTPSQVANRVIDCIDDEYLEEWRKEISRRDVEIQERASKTQELATQTIAGLQREIELAIDAMDKANTVTEISDQRVRDALKAYITIVKLEFDTPQQKWQNIKNASYFIWALFAPNSDAANVFFNNYGKETTTTDTTQNFGRSN